jgi:hypothetical protein
VRWVGAHGMLGPREFRDSTVDISTETLAVPAQQAAIHGRTWTLWLNRVDGSVQYCSGSLSAVIACVQTHHRIAEARNLLRDA